MSDLKEVPIDDLIQEIFNRTESCVIGYTRYEDAGSPIIYVNHQCLSGWLTGLGLCQCIEHTILKEHLEEKK